MYSQPGQILKRGYGLHVEDCAGHDRQYRN